MRGWITIDDKPYFVSCQHTDDSYEVLDPFTDTRFVVSANVDYKPHKPKLITMSKDETYVYLGNGLLPSGTIVEVVWVYPIGSYYVARVRDIKSNTMVKVNPYTIAKLDY